MNQPQQHRYIHPFTDFGFKKIFGSEENKELLIDFLNQILEKENITIKDLSYKNTNRLPRSSEDRLVIFDLYCESDKGEKFTIELQKAKQEYFKDRMLYYSTYSIQEQGQKGPWDYLLKPVFVVAVLNFTFKSKKQDKVVSGYKILDTETHEAFSDKLNFFTIEIPKFTKKEEELVTNLDKWLYLLKHLYEMDTIPKRFQRTILEKVFKIAEYAALSREEAFEYEESLKIYNDLQNSLETAENTGFQKAENVYIPQLEEALRQKEEAIKREEEAIKKQAEERRQKEEERRQKEEAQTSLRRMVQKLLAKGFTLEEIAEDLGKSMEEIKHLT